LNRDATNMKALLIDDNTEMTDMIAQFLTLKGFDCTVSNRGRDGLELALGENYDIILLDIAMPEVSGFHIIEALEKVGKLREKKVIVLTASSVTDEELKDLVNRGVYTCMKKPVELGILFDTIRTCAQS
jgi:DNA-binding response OmpR family regulator